MATNFKASVSQYIAEGKKDEYLGMMGPALPLCSGISLVFCTGGRSTRFIFYAAQQQPSPQGILYTTASHTPLCYTAAATALHSATQQLI